MDNEKFITLHRHWMWSNIMKQHFDTELQKDQNLAKNFNIADKEGAYMLLWYALLFSVLETFKDSKIKFPPIQEDIKSVYSPLKDLRNAVFHPQNKYWSRKLNKFLETKGTPEKIRRIHSFLGGYFLEEINKRRSKVPKDG